MTIEELASLGFTLNCAGAYESRERRVYFNETDFSSHSVTVFAAGGFVDAELHMVFFMNGEEQEGVSSIALPGAFSFDRMNALLRVLGIPRGGAL